MKVLYNHFPKCAGSSCTNWLNGYFSKDVRWESDCINTQESIEAFRKLSDGDVDKIHLITGHCVGQLVDRLSGFITTTTLREPVEREVSLYNYFVRIGHTELGIEDWVDSSCESRYPGRLELLETYHVIGFQENLQPFCRDVIRCTGFGMTEMPRLNVAESETQLSGISKSVRRRISSKVSEDIDTYRRLRGMFSKDYS